MTQPETTIGVSGETKERLRELKRDGLTWDAFVNDLADSYEQE
jgi:hypothetical protein